MRWYNFRQSQELLDVNPKTFVRWLQDAGIDARTDPADPRQKLISEDQLRMLAEKHGRTLILPPEDISELPAPVTLPALDERLSTLEQQITRQLAAIVAQNQHILQVLADLQQHQANQARRASLPHKEPSAAPAAPPAQTQRAITHPASKTPARKKSAKKTTGRVRKMPSELTPLLEFARQHQVSPKAVEHAVDSGKLAITRGPWKHNNQLINRALDSQGRQQFYQHFQEREDFRPCAQCPHTA